MEETKFKLYIVFVTTFLILLIFVIFFLLKNNRKKSLELGKINKEKKQKLVEENEKLKKDNHKKRKAIAKKEKEKYLYYSRCTRSLDYGFN